MTTDKAPTVLGRAEAGSRQIVLQIGLGVVAFILGSIMSVGAAMRVGERLGPLESDWAALVFRWAFERLWLLAVLPFFGYAIGRFTEMKPARFALVSGLSGETFSVLLVTAINGTDYLLEDQVGLLARGATLFLGMAISAVAVRWGREAAGQAQLEANAIAEQRKAEYADFLAAAEGRSGLAASPALAPLDPAPSTALPQDEPQPSPPRGEGGS